MRIEDGFIEVETQGAAVPAGPATADTDDDGHDDTAVVVEPDGTTTFLTDVDGDGVADLATEITADAVVTVAEHVGDGAWVVRERSHLGSAGDRMQDSDGWAPGAGASAESTVSVDPVTGEWVRGPAG